MKDWKRSFYALWAAQWLSIIGFSFVIPLTPLFVQELGITDLQEVEWWSGLLAASTAITLAVCSPFWGVLADQHGRKVMVQRAMFGGAIVVAAMALSRGVYDLLILRSLQGVVAGTVTASVALAAVVSPRQLMGRNLGLMQTAVFAGSSLGPFIGGIMADRFGFRPVFLITGAALFLGGLTVTALVKEPVLPTPGPANVNVVGMFRDLRAAVGGHGLLAMNVALFAVQAATWGVSSMLSLFVQTIVVDDANVASITGVVFGLTALSSALAAAVIGRYSDRWGYRRVLFWAAIGAAVFAVPQAFVANTWQLIALRLVQGIFLGGVVPTANAVIGYLTPPERRGAAFGVTASATALGNAAGPLASAVIAASFGLRAVFLFTALLLFAVSIWITRLRVENLPLQKAS